MSNNTARLARQWAERAKNSKYFDEYADDAAAAVEHVLATTPPPTMADIGWNDAEHYLAGAVDADGHEVVMLDKLHGNIRVCDVDQMGPGRPVLESPKTITPNGKRYELREVGATVSSNENVGPDQPEHPATLFTQKDYEDAPVGTIVAQVDGHPWMKAHPIRWESGVKTLPNRDISVIGPHQVLRWGWGK